MKPRGTLGLLALLVVLGAAAVMVQGPWSSDRVREHAAALPGLVAADVRAVTVARAGTQVLLSRADTGWTVGPEKLPADGAAVDGLLADLAGLEVSAVVSKNAAKQAVYETDTEKGIAVRLEGEGGRLIAAFVVGKRGPDFASAYLKRDGAREVLLVSRDVRTPLARPAESWKESPKPAESPAAAKP